MGVPKMLSQRLFQYVVATTWLHQLPLLGRTAAAFPLQVVPLELQRCVINDIVKNRAYQAVIPRCAVYLSAVAIQGGRLLAAALSSLVPSEVPLATQSAMNRSRLRVRPVARCRTVRRELAHGTG